MDFDVLINLGDSFVNFLV